MTRRQEIRAALLEALNTSRPMDVPETQRRMGPFQAGELPAMRLAPSRELVDSRMPNGKRGPAATRRLQFALECYGAGDEDDLEPLLAWGVAATSGRLGGIVAAVEETGTLWEFAGEDQDYTKATLTLTVEYFTKIADPSAGLPASS